MSYSRSLTRQRREFAAGEGPTVSPATTYAGVLSTPFVAPALKLASTLQNGYVRQIDGIQNKAVISNLSSDTEVIQAANCDWNDGNDLILGERVLELTDLAVMEALCRKTLLPTWAGMTGARESMTAGSPEFVNFAMATVAGYSAQGVENGIWKSIGTTMTSGFLSNDGTFDNAGYNASTIGAALPAANEATVLALGFSAPLGATGAFETVYLNAQTNCPAVLNRPDAAFYCGTKLAGAYMHALGVAGGSGYQTNVTNQGFTNLQYLGIPVHVCPGMPEDVLVLTYEENLVVGSNLGTDYTSANYIDAWQFDGSDQVKIAMRFGLGCQVGIPSDIVVGAEAAIFA